MAFGVCRNNIKVDRFDYGVDIIWNIIDEETKMPFDLSGYEIQIIIKKDTYAADKNAIFDTTVTGDGSQVVLPLEEELTKNLPGTYYYALRLIEDGRFVDTIIQAQFIICSNTFSEAV